jgi:A/G-specific adenine glycosylase
VTEQHGGELPRTLEGLLSLPGVGPYTAGAIASIAHGLRVPVVDGNVIRVLCRFLGLRGDPAAAPLKKEIWQHAAELVPEQRPGDFNQALMELGATVCSPSSPQCPNCPLAERCVARAQGLTTLLPELAPRTQATRVATVAALLTRKQTFAVEQLPDDAPRWARMWQFPTVELTPDEDPLAALARAARRAGALAQSPQLLATVQHSVTRYRITLQAYLCAAPSMPGKALGARAARVEWKTLPELAALAMPAAQRRLANALVSHFEASQSAATPTTRKERAGASGKPAKQARSA